MDELDPLARLKQHAAQLAEWYDSVIIFATRQDPDGIFAGDYREGNYYAALGHVDRWLRIQHAHDAASAAREDDE